MEKRKGLNVLARPGVPRKFERSVRRICRAVEKVVRFEHPVKVTIFHITPGCEGCIRASYEDEHDWGYGIYLCDKNIGIADDLDEHEQAFVLTHEVVHYEQDRDGRELIERGVNKRARTIRRLAGIAVPDDTGVK